MNKFTDRQRTMNLMRKGIKEQAEELKAKQEANKQDENVQDIPLHDNNMTQDQKIDLLMEAVADIAIKVNGGSKDGE